MGDHRCAAGGARWRGPRNGETTGGRETGSTVSTVEITATPGLTQIAVQIPATSGLHT